MIEHGWRGACGVVKGRDIVVGQHEAIVHISGADNILVDLVGFEIPSGGSRHHPVRGHLDRAAGQKSFAAGQASPGWLCRTIAVHHTPPPTRATPTRPNPLNPAHNSPL